MYTSVRKYGPPGFKHLNFNFFFRLFYTISIPNLYQLKSRVINLSRIGV